MAFVDEVSSFAFGARQRHGRYAVDLNLKAQFELQLLGYSCRLFQVIFDFDDELVHRAVFSGSDSVFNDLGEAVQDLFDCGGIHIHAADYEHVVSTAHNSAVEKYESVRDARIPDRSNEVAGAIANDWRAGAAESCE